MFFSMIGLASSIPPAGAAEHEARCKEELLHPKLDTTCCRPKCEDEEPKRTIRKERCGEVWTRGFAFGAFLQRNIYFLILLASAFVSCVNPIYSTYPWFSFLAHKHCIILLSQSYYINVILICIFNPIYTLLALAQISVSNDGQQRTT